MLVASSFDLWQKDAFFTAAEEVQQSADILDSSYRSWIKVKREGLPNYVVDELHRELMTALGTAKWQLEEFERAVGLSHGSCRDEDRAARHQQFVSVMETQVSRVEDELNMSLHEEGKQPLRWVNLDEEEKDDLAMFLSGTCEDRKDEIVKAVMCSERESLYNLEEVDCKFKVRGGEMDAELRSHLKGSTKDEIAIDMGNGSSDDPSAREVPGMRDELCCPTDGTVSTRRTWTVPNVAPLQIIVPDEHERWRTSAACIEATPKVKGSRMLNSFPIRAVSWIKQIPQCSNIFGRKMQIPWRLNFSQSIQLMIALLLTIFLLVSLTRHST